VLAAYRALLQRANDPKASAATRIACRARALAIFDRMTAADQRAALTER
jgi:hypothetical protein